MKKFLSKKFSNKAIIEVQFGWIFSLIAGLIIFAFIMSLVFNSQKHANDALNVDVGEKLSTSIKGNLQVSDSYNEITMLSSAKISFACDSDLKTTTMRVNDAPLAERFTDVIFAPLVLTTNKIQVGVKDFSLAFIISRFTYITSPNTAYILYYKAQTPASAEETMANQLYDLLPVNISKKMAGTPALLAGYTSDYDHYKIICFNNACPTAAGTNYIKVEAVNNYLDGYGNVTWHYGSDTKSSFLTSSGLIGAIFSDNKQYYDCEMARAYSFMDIKRELQYNRIEQMTPDLNQYNFECVPLLAQHEYILNNMTNARDAALLYNDAVNLRQANLDSGFMGCPKVS